MKKFSSSIFVEDQKNKQGLFLLKIKIKKTKNNDKNQKNKLQKIFA